jgi:threonyl-tRNA synthetase
LQLPALDHPFNSDHIKAELVNAEQMKVHPADEELVIRNRDLEASAVSLRVHGQGNLGAKPRDEVVADLLQSINDPRA